MTHSIIQKSQLEGALRLDAEYYQPEYLMLQKNINVLGLSSIKDLNISVDASAFYSSVEPFYTNSGTPFLRVADVVNLQLSKTYVFLPTDIIQREKTVKIGKPGDIIITKGGTVANVAMLPNDFSEYGLCRDLILVETSKIPLDFAITILLFLSTKFGIFQLFRGQSMQVQAHLTLPMIRNLLVPSNQANEASKVYLESMSEHTKSKTLYQQAEDLLLDELGLKDFGEENDLFSIMKFNDVLTANRIDAEYFQPKYLRLQEKLKSKSQLLLKLVQNVPAKFDPTKELDKEFEYVELSNINSVNGLIDGYEVVLGKETPGRAKRVLKAGDVIVSSVEGSLDKVALVSKEQEGYLASTGFFQLRSNKIAPEVLLILMKSIVVQWQLKQNCAGTILTAVPSEALNKMYIPEISQSVAEQIIIFVTESQTARQKSKELLEEAKRKVEEMIEKGGE